LLKFFECSHSIHCFNHTVLHSHFNLLLAHLSKLIKSIFACCSLFLHLRSLQLLHCLLSSVIDIYEILFLRSENVKMSERTFNEDKRLVLLQTFRSCMHINMIHIIVFSFSINKASALFLLIDAFLVRASSAINQLFILMIDFLDEQLDQRSLSSEFVCTSQRFFLNEDRSFDRIE
jgi:hypothetical protein